MSSKHFCDFCNAEIKTDNEPNREMKYRHDTYCTIDKKKQHVGDIIHDIAVNVDIFDKDNNLVDTCKDCLLEIVKQM